MKCKNIAIVVNPRAGKGLAVEMVKRISADLVKESCVVTLYDSQLEYEEAFVTDMLEGKDALLIAGGDGTILQLLAALRRSRIPLYMLPCGNQSLAAGLFHMNGSSQEILACLRRGEAEEHFLASVNGRPFLHMCSLGFDSSVVDLVHKNRKGPVGNIAYVKAGLSSFFSFRDPRIEVQLDGEPWISGKRGFLFVANSRMYACGTNPMPEASTLVKDLEIGFLEDMSLTDYLAWAGAGMFSSSVKFKWTKRSKATRVEITVPDYPAYPIQVDGDIAARGQAMIEAGAASMWVLKTDF